MATLYEYYNTDDDGSWEFYGITWLAQTFTPAIAHKITSVKLKLYKLGNPGTVTVSIQGVDENDHPDGTDLCSGTTDGDTLPIESPFEWREITLGDGASLEADTKYAIVVKALDGSAGNSLFWREDASSPTYELGCLEYTPNSGVLWITYTNIDNMFEDWGEAIAVGRSFGYIIG